jgi:hypothetical protein
MSRVGVTLRRILDWIYWTFYIHNSGQQAIERYC